MEAVLLRPLIASKAAAGEIIRPDDATPSRPAMLGQSLAASASCIGLNHHFSE
jgi:hypothetical protein